MDENLQKILVIEDDSNIRELVMWNLAEEGYTCISAADGKEGLDAVRNESPDLILLDLMLPYLDGFELIKVMRLEGIETPVIMLTAKNEEADKVIGLEFGADDYITKPFSVRELKARIKAVLRRYKTEAFSGKEKGASENAAIDLEDLVIDILRHEVRAEGEQVILTLKEFELLQTLAENRGRVLTRNQLLDIIWGYDYPGETRTVDVHIRYLRRKLKGAGYHILTVRGLGYKLL